MKNKEKMLGVMLDCSRNAVMTADNVKKYALILKKMGYNTLMLYTEDTYEVDNQPYFGYLRGRYSKDEIKDIDRYCAEIGIELVPCIQTLAHVNCIFKWVKEYGDICDCDDILLAESEKTYALINDMFSTIAECFSSRKIHIGMDEAYKVGLGKYRELHGNKERFDIINNHLHKVCEIAEKYGFEPMLWSDMFCKLALNIENQYESADLEKIRGKANLPKSASLVYWDYYSTDYDRYVSNIKTNKAFQRKVYFAGGAWTWKGFTPDNGYSIETTKAAVKACRDCGVDGILFTVWGDDGAECSKYAVLPTLMYAAEAINGNTDMASIKEKFKNITGSDFDAFFLLDKINNPGGRHERDTNKYLFYNDVFLGIHDLRCTENDEKFYADLTNELKTVKETGEYAYLFETGEKLASVLAIKTNLGNKTRMAYKANDKNALKELIPVYDELLKRVDEFYNAFYKQWIKENKPHGFDVQDIRFGGVIQRLKSGKRRIAEYVNGEITEIPELAETILDSKWCQHRWATCVTPNVISHNLIS